jgi:hypothetical protein
MALGISNRLLSVPPISEREADIAHIPFVIGFLFEYLDPHIRNSHGKPVVESNPTKGKRKTKSGHTRDILGNCHAIRVYLMQHLIGEHEIYYSFFINCRAKVLVVAARKSPSKRQLNCTKVSQEFLIEDALRSNAMVIIQDARDAVESEAVKTILVHPEA